MLPDNACASCGTTTQPVRESFKTRIHGEDIDVPDIDYLKCPACGDVLLSLEPSAKVSQVAKEIYRQKHDLLSPVEIRKVREQFGLTVSMFAALLHADERTVSRWDPCRIWCCGCSGISPAATT